MIDAITITPAQNTSERCSFIPHLLPGQAPASSAATLPTTRQDKPPMQSPPRKKARDTATG
jgi:hypothetical protein